MVICIFLLRFYKRCDHIGCQGLWGGKNGISLMGREFQFYKIRRVLEIDGGDGLYNSVNVLHATELYTLVKRVHFVMYILSQLNAIMWIYKICKCMTLLIFFKHLLCSWPWGWPSAGLQFCTGKWCPSPISCASTVLASIYPALLLSPPWLPPCPFSRSQVPQVAVEGGIGQWIEEGFWDGEGGCKLGSLGQTGSRQEAGPALCQPTCQVLGARMNKSMRAMLGWSCVWSARVVLGWALGESWRGAPESAQLQLHGG